MMRLQTDGLYFEVETFGAPFNPGMLLVRSMGIPAAHLLGMSMGGMSTQHLLAHAFRRLVTAPIVMSNICDALLFPITGEQRVEIVRRRFERAFYPNGQARQLAAIKNFHFAPQSMGPESNDTLGAHVADHVVKPIQTNTVEIGDDVPY